MTDVSKTSEQQSSPVDDLGLSGERLAELAPSLRELLRDFQRLEELIEPGTEPAPTPELEGYADAQR